MAVGLGLTNVGRLPVWHLQVDLDFGNIGLAIRTGLFLVDLIDNVASLVRSAGAIAPT